MTRAFLSHAAEDREVLERSLIPPLRAAEVEPWYSRYDITFGEEWQQSIRQAIRSSQWFLLALSQDSASSKWVKAEVNLAFGELGDGHIVVLRLDDTDPALCDIRLPALQSIDLRETDDSSLRRLIARLAEPRPLREPHGDEAVGARSPSLSRADSPRFDIVSVFSGLASTEDRTRERAAKALRALAWGPVTELVISLAHDESAKAIDAVLDGLAALEAHQRTEQLLVQLCPILKGDLRVRAVKLLERKRLSLDRDHLASLFDKNRSPFQILRVLGNGVFTASFLSRHRISNHRAVVRVLLKPHAAQDNVRTQFIELCSLSTRLVHQSLALTREVGMFADENIYFAVRDFIDGPTLQDAFDAGRTFTVRQSLSILRQVGAAIAAVHAGGIVHHAVKPSNMFLVGDNGVVLGDPSLPINLVPLVVERLAYDYRYAAPECLRADRRVTPAADLYSLGCVAYQLFCGQPPFVSASAYELMRLHVEGQIDPPSKRRAPIGAQGDDIARRLLAVDPRDRISAASELQLLFRDDTDPQSSRAPTAIHLLPGPARHAMEVAYSVIPITPEPRDRLAPSDGPPALPAGKAPRRPAPDDQGGTDIPPRPLDSSVPGGPPSEALKAPTWADPSYRAPMPDRIGPYVIRSIIGEGGFGVVYLAERREPYFQRVALKIIKPGMDTRAVMARFDQERQALALMDHPNVARVFDAGATAEGRPYFVMEYVPGDSITDYCDKERLTVRQRLDLFIRVCDALQHAHEKGLIHRDVKPSNILVTAVDGIATPKVIDFGVAKAVTHALTEMTVFTEAGQLIGTPEYMSPEQATFGAIGIDARADVYSLGAVLFELLTGSAPFRARELRMAGYAEIQRIIREVEPDRPSYRVASLKEEHVEATVLERRKPLAATANELRGDLDLIVLCALRKERERRYSSAADFAADLRRYIENRPIAARPSSVSYLARKFLTRHRTAVTVVVVGLLCSLLAFILGKFL